MRNITAILKVLGGFWDLAKKETSPWTWLSNVKGRTFQEMYLPWAIQNGKPIPCVIRPRLNPVLPPPSDRYFGSWQEAKDCTLELMGKGWIGGCCEPLRSHRQLHVVYRAGEPRTRVNSVLSGKGPSRKAPLVYAWFGWVEPKEDWAAPFQNLLWVRSVQFHWDLMLEGHPLVMEKPSGEFKVTHLNATEFVVWILNHMFHRREVTYIPLNHLSMKAIGKTKLGFFDIMSMNIYQCGKEVVLVRRPILAIERESTLDVEDPALKAALHLMPEIKDFGLDRFLRWVRSRTDFVLLMRGPKEFPWLR